jgi:hypothetical protein
MNSKLLYTMPVQSQYGGGLTNEGVILTVLAKGFKRGVGKKKGNVAKVPMGQAVGARK